MKSEKITGIKETQSYVRVWFGKLSNDLLDRCGDGLYHKDLPIDNRDELDMVQPAPDARFFSVYDKVKISLGDGQVIYTKDENFGYTVYFGKRVPARSLLSSDAELTRWEHDEVRNASACVYEDGTVRLMTPGSMTLEEYQSKNISSNNNLQL